ncbi:prepilin-type N-terminal cleavage/methylation domain-containing protein [Rhizobacter sp. AJA081-3]|nr:prepilin-type N-terminal cleavage/methylation domain-containing protein [Rhizobacter sp. AJA081-3]
MRCANPRRCRGFTMIELVIVMAMLGLLLSLALPQYMATLERGREQVLQSNLAALREAIDKFHGDRGRYPDKLEDLVTQRYLRAIPVDPFTESPTWVVVAPRDADKGGVIDVQSTMTDLNGEPRRAAAVATDAAADALPNRVAREGGSSMVVTATAVAASAPEAGGAR